MEKDPYLLKVFYVLVFYVIYRLLDFVVIAIAIIQVGHQLIIGERHKQLACFGDALGHYIAQIVHYLAWSDDTKPYPFQDWPSSNDD